MVEHGDENLLQRYADLSYTRTDTRRKRSVMESMMNRWEHKAPGLMKRFLDWRLSSAERAFAKAVGEENSYTDSFHQYIRNYPGQYPLTEVLYNFFADNSFFSIIYKFNRLPDEAFPIRGELDALPVRVTAEGAPSVVVRRGNLPTIGLPEGYVIIMRRIIGLAKKDEKQNYYQYALWKPDLMVQSRVMRPDPSLLDIIEWSDNILDLKTYSDTDYGSPIRWRNLGVYTSYSS